MGETSQDTLEGTERRGSLAEGEVVQQEGEERLTEPGEKDSHKKEEYVEDETQKQTEEDKQGQTSIRTKDDEDTNSTCSNSTSSSTSNTSSSSTTSTSSSTPTSSEGECSPPSSKESPRVIQIEDSDKKYCVAAPTKLKSWLVAFNSLAPRTRQTVRTVLIALISALALLAIFHLAKLAEHPVSENEIEVEAAVGNVVGERPSENIYKSKDGKVVRKPGGESGNWPAGGRYAEGADAGGGEFPIQQSPIQDMLSRNGYKKPYIHPILGVPVSRDIMAHDIERLKKIDRARNRPANSTEVKRTLDLVRTTVEADRKRLTSKALRFWSTGETPLRVLLVTTWRSGSTFLGQVLANHPAVFHHYEPLSNRGIHQVRSGRDAFQAQQLLHRLLDCQYSGLTEYLNYTRAHPEDMLGHNRPVWDACRHGPNTNACYNTSFLSSACEMFPIQLVKTVRLRLNLTQLFLNDEKMNVKVVFLVRDPRATMSSRYSSVSWCSDKPDCSSPEILCSDLQGDLKVATALKQLYPQQFKMIKYEDLATNPQSEIQSLMEFLGMEFSSRISEFIDEHTQMNENAPWSTKRKSADRVSMWKKQLPLQEVHTIQNACESVMKTLGYELMGQ